MSLPLRRVIPATRFQPISSRLEAPPTLYRKEPVPLSKEQLAQRRIEAKKYYSELSRKKGAGGAGGVPRGKVEVPIQKIQKTPTSSDTRSRAPHYPPPPPPMHREKQKFKRATQLGRGDMPPVPEHPVEDIWREIGELTEQLVEMRPCQLPRGDVERHVAMVWTLVE